MRKSKTKKTGVRKTKTKAFQKKAKARNARRIGMSRAEDLKDVEGQIEGLEKQIQESANDFKQYNEEVTAAIRTVMEEAGVWAEVHGLEQERSEAQQRLQGKIQQLQQDLASKRVIKDFLVGRENQDKHRKEKSDSDEKPEGGSKKKHPTPPA